MNCWCRNPLNIMLLLFLAIFLIACATQSSVISTQATVDYDLLLKCLKMTSPITMSLAIGCAYLLGGRIHD